MAQPERRCQGECAGSTRRRATGIRKVPLEKKRARLETKPGPPEAFRLHPQSFSSARPFSYSFGLFGRYVGTGTSHQPLLETAVCGHSRAVMISTRLGRPDASAFWTATAISCMVCRKSPSPAIPRTGASGAASLAPMAPGTVKPIVEKPPLVIWVRGIYTSNSCQTWHWTRPAPVTTIVSRGVTARISFSAREMVVGRAIERCILARTLSHSALSRWISLKYAVPL